MSFSSIHQDIPVDIFKKRRKALSQKMEKDSALLLFSHPKQIRNYDVPFPYRQDSDFFYLTGFEEPESAFLFLPQAETQSVLFVLPKDRDQERWEGLRHGVQKSKEKFHMDQVFKKEDLQKEAPPLLRKISKLYCKIFSHPVWDDHLKNILNQVKLFKGKLEDTLPALKDAKSLVSKLRIYKSPYEIQQIKKAAHISSEAHQELMKQSFPGQKERYLHGLFLQEIMKRGAVRESYESIVASGENATVIHYRGNHQELKKGDMILVDAGAEYNYYAADITRTYPVKPPFSASQKRVYKKLLNLQKHLIESIQPGLSLQELHDKSVSLLIELLLDENWLKGTKEDIKSSSSYKMFYPHGIGHLLGMDAHDSGEMKKGEKKRSLEAGMCLTVEPGLYIPKNIESLSPLGKTLKIEDDLKGMGLRIEDNILVTHTGYENLTQNCPKEIEDLENLVGTRLL